MTSVSASQVRVPEKTRPLAGNYADEGFNPANALELLRGSVRCHRNKNNMAEKAADVDSISTHPTVGHPLGAQLQTGRVLTAVTTRDSKVIELALANLKNHVISLQEQHRTLKPQLEKVTKDLAALGAKPDDPIEQVKMPIDTPLIEKVMAALDDKGRSVKNFQVALGIFDLTDLGRKRKALMAAGVTEENTNGNSIEVTLSDEFQQAVLDAKRKPEGEEVVTK